MELSDRDLVINKDEVFSKLEIIGQGDEGVVFNYKNKYAIKIFRNLINSCGSAKTKLRLMKINKMMEEKDDNCCLPLGFVSFDGKNINGVYSKLVKHKELVDFNSLRNIKNKNIRAKYLIMGDSVLERIHNKGFVVGDVKTDNILIDENDNVQFIDCDNYKYKYFSFDNIPTRAGFYYRVYGHDLAYLDNDKLVYTIMALELLTDDEDFHVYQNHDGLRKAVKRLNLDKETEDYLNIIISDRLNKPYVGPIINKIMTKKKTYN